MKKKPWKKKGAEEDQSSPASDARWEFVQKFGVDLTWEKIVALDPRGRDEVKVTAIMGKYGGNAQGVAVTRERVEDAIEELMKQVKEP